MRGLTVHSLLLLLLVGVASLSLGCQPAALPPATSYLDPYKPALLSWSPEDEAAWSAMPRYAITATLDLENMQVTGTANVQFTNRSAGAMNEICFRLYPNLALHDTRMVVTSITAKGLSLDFEEAANSTAIVIPCDPPLAAGQIAVLDLTFRVDVPEKEDAWTLFGRSQNIVSLPDFYPVLAVYDAKGWHREIAPAYADAAFSDAALYQVDFTAPADLTFAMTGVEVGQTPAGEGLVTHHIVSGPIREFLIIGSPAFQVETTEAYGTTVKSYFMEEDREAGMQALLRAASALRVYSDAYGPYPYTEMSVVAAPLTYRGMEFSGVNLIGLDTYRAHRNELDYLVIHEVAHQWFYSLVGNNQIMTPWLDEGLAEFSAYTYYCRTYGRKWADELRDSRWLATYEYARDNRGDAVMDQPANAFQDGQLYETIAYAKAALFFDVLRRTLGDDTFYKVITEYVQEHRFRNATPEEFFILAQRVSGHDLVPLIQEWILTAGN